MIVIRNLKKKYGKNQVLKGISLEVLPNEILALIGPSGCGKTTLLRLLAGFEQPDEGQVLIDDIIVSKSDYKMAPNKRNLSMIFQDLALWPHMNTESHIRFVLKNKAMAKKDLHTKINDILESVNLNNFNKSYPHQLSGGEKQRLAIARGIAPNPNYLLMDEPFSNLDPILKEELENFTMEIKQKFHMAIVYVTHNIEEVFRLADRIAIMNKGELIQINKKDQVIRNPENDFVVKLLKL